MPVTYVTADVAGAMESPVYAILELGPAIDNSSSRKATRSSSYIAHQPFNDDKLAMKWDGEWHITYEVFRDLGIAFAAVLILIYILVVGWFQSFMTPLIDHGGDSVFAGRHSAGARPDGRVLHRDLDDRLHRRRRNRRAQFDHPGGFRRTATEAGNAAGLRP